MERHGLLVIRSEKELRHPYLSNWMMWVLLIKVRVKEHVL